MAKSVKQEAHDYLKQRRAQALATREFPKKDWDNVKPILHKAMSYCSVHTIGCHKFTYENFVTFKRPFFMLEVQLMMTILKGATPIELGQTLEENLAMLTNIVDPIEDEWMKIDDEITIPIEREIETKLKIDKVVPLGQKIFKERK